MDTKTDRRDGDHHTSGQAIKAKHPRYMDGATLKPSAHVHDDRTTSHQDFQKHTKAAYNTGTEA